MRLDYIEVGTSDFDTLVETNNGVGISVEPLSLYLNKLPNKENNIKVHAAISDEDGYCMVFYIHPDDILTYNLPEWLKGCNSIKTPHPSAVKVLTDNGLNHIYRSEKIKIITWDTLIRDYSISYVDYLKLDTEGHDTVILNSILNSTTNILPKKILFETNVLINPEDIKKILIRLKNRGYEIIENYGDNILVEYRSNLPTKIIFSSNDSRYLKYWSDNSKMCSEILQITPILIHITNEDSDFMWDEFGLIKKIKCDNNTSLAAQVSRLYSGVFFPNEKIIISDIDMFFFDKNYLKKSLINSEFYDVTIVGSDSYDKNRPECLEFLHSCKERFPMCFIVCYGNILNNIMNINTNTIFQNFLDNNNFNFGFNSDEIVFTNNLLKTDYKINRVNREYVSNFYLKERIEKYMFTENSTFRINLNYLNNLNGYSEFHCPDYDEHVDTIKHLLSLIYNK